jgi:hypothetical protein
MPSAAEQLDYILKGGMTAGRLAGCEYAFDVSQEPTGGTIGLQGLVLSNRRPV